MVLLRYGAIDVVGEVEGEVGGLVVKLVDVVVGGSVVVDDVVDVEVLVVEVVVVVVVASTTARPNVPIAETMNWLRVRYPDTVRCTPSATNRLADLGVNAVFQSAIVRFGYLSFADRNSLLKRTPRARQSPRPVEENSTLTHNTGSPRVLRITSSITHRGYQVSGFEIMSFVPSAMTRAVVVDVSPLSMTLAPSDALRPTFASMTTLVHVPRASTFVVRDPNASVPTVRLSPTMNKVPWPLMPRAGDLPCTGGGETNRKVANTRPTDASTPDKSRNR